MESKLQSRGWGQLGGRHEAGHNKAHSGLCTVVYTTVCDHYSAASLPISPHLKCIPHATLHHPLLDKDQQTRYLFFSSSGQCFAQVSGLFATAEKVSARSSSTSSSGKPTSLLNGIAWRPICMHTDAPTRHTQARTCAHTCTYRHTLRYFLYTKLFLDTFFS